jgi:HlyD family secretion protein
VRAPFDGYVVAKHAERGQWITRGAPIVELASAEVEVTVAVPEHYIGAIQLGDPATVQVGALAARQFPATIDRIVPRADARARTFPVKIRLENPGTQNGHLLKGGMLAQVTLQVDQPRRSLLVPKDALVLGGQQPLVFVVREDPQTGELKTVPVSVTLGVAQEHRTEVTGALEAGERVVVEGNERLRPGTIVRLMDSPAA